MVKAAITAIKGLVALIAAGGWVAVIIILIICLIGLFVGSIFGIFFSGEDSGSGYTMPMAIQEINQEYADKMTEIRGGNSHDDVVMSGIRAAWKEVLAVYAVKINSDPDNAQDVATMDESKKELLSSVFWDMNIITHCTETKQVTEVTVEGDGETFTSTETTVTKTILYIIVSSKTAEEMAQQYGFSEQQKAQLAELLSNEYASLWTAVLYGIHNGSGDIVAVAISQIGNVNGEPCHAMRLSIRLPTEIVYTTYNIYCRKIFAIFLTHAHSKWYNSFVSLKSSIVMDDLLFELETKKDDAIWKS